MKVLHAWRTPDGLAAMHLETPATFWKPSVIHRVVCLRVGGEDSFLEWADADDGRVMYTIPQRDFAAHTFKARWALGLLDEGPDE